MWLLRPTAGGESPFPSLLFYAGCGSSRIWNGDMTRTMPFCMKICLCFYMIFVCSMTIIETALTAIPAPRTPYQAPSDAIGLVGTPLINRNPLWLSLSLARTWYRRSLMNRFLSSFGGPLLYIQASSLLRYAEYAKDGQASRAGVER